MSAPIMSEAQQFAEEVRRGLFDDVQQIVLQLSTSITPYTPVDQYSPILQEAISSLIGLNYMSVTTVNNFTEFYSSIGADTPVVPDMSTFFGTPYEPTFNNFPTDSFSSSSDDDDGYISPRTRTRNS